MSETEELRKQLVGVLKSRAMAFAAIYDEVARELGPDRALALMQRAIYARGAAMGKGFARFAPADFAGLCDSFLGVLPDKARPFQPEVLKNDAEGLDIKFHACPQKEAWIEAGLPPERVATMCAIAGAIDNGTFEGAGFALQAETWAPGRDGCCLLKIRRAQATQEGAPLRNGD